jgi:coenzyme F420-reducing hydrogenase gamma subunit
MENQRGDTMAKPKIAVFSLTSCEGCSLQILNCEDELPELLNHVEIVNFREAASNRSDDYDIAFVDGAVSTPSDETEIREIRSHAKVLVAIGACACTGGLNVMKNFKGLDYCLNKVYGDKAKVFKTIDAQPIDAVVKVEVKIHGCPMPKEEFLEVVKAVLSGRRPRIPNFPVCVECKLKGNVCLWRKNKSCLGVVARAGCGAICPTYLKGCEACRGLIDEPNHNACKEIMTEYGLTMDQIMKEFQLYNGFYPVSREEE